MFEIFGIFKDFQESVRDSWSDLARVLTHFAPPPPYSTFTNGSISNLQRCQYVTITLKSENKDFPSEAMKRQKRTKDWNKIALISFRWKKLSVFSFHFWKQCISSIPRWEKNLTGFESKNWESIASAVALLFRLLFINRPYSISIRERNSPKIYQQNWTSKSNKSVIGL